MPLTHVWRNAQSASLWQGVPQEPFMQTMQAPLTQSWLGGQSASVEQSFAQVGSLQGWQAPLTHDSPLGHEAALSITPSQSLSIPSQTSAEGWQTLFGVHTPPTQISPASQSASVLQGSVQNPFMQAWQVPLTQSSFGGQSESTAQPFAQAGSLKG
jgi:hypothetical protein